MLVGYDEHAAVPLYDEPYLMVARPFQSGGVLPARRSSSPRSRHPARTGKDAAASELSLDRSWQTARYLERHGLQRAGRRARVRLRPPRRAGQVASALARALKCLDFATGKVLWETRPVGHATVVVADGKLILFNDQGELILARATPDRYEELARTAVFRAKSAGRPPPCTEAVSICEVRPGPRASISGTRKGSMPDRRSARPASATVPPGRIDLTRLVGGERPYAFDPADARELGQWFAFSLLGVFAPAAVLAMAAGYVADKRSRQTTSFASPRVAWGVFWGAAFVLGIAGTPVFNRVTGSFVFTWPVCLFVAHQVALNTMVRSNRRPDGDSPRRWQSWAAMAATLLLFGVCLAYFLVCRRLSLATEWTFLMGFIPTWPLALPAAYRFRRGIRSWEGLLWTLFGFAAFFWSAGAILIWRVHYLSAAAMVR